MFPSSRGAGSTQFALRVQLVSIAAVIVGCSANPASGGLEVRVELAPGLVSRCVKVSATDGTLTRETMPIPLAGKSSPLRIGVKSDGMASPVTVQALGYSDEGCETRTPGEESETKMGNFTNPPGSVTVTLRPASNGDGGFNGDGGPDAGTDAGADAGLDAGVDAGVDAGIDQDMDTYPLPDDCDDTNPAIYPGATELCSDVVDNDCDNMPDCQDSTCNMMSCAGGGLCTGNVCVAPTESVCNDGLDNNNNGLIDCADPDCPVNSVCSDNNSCTTGDRCVADGGCEKMFDTMCTSPPNTQCWMMSGVCMPDAGATCLYTQRMGMCDDGLACTQNSVCTNGTCGSGAPVTCSSPPGVCFEPMGTCSEPSGACSYAPRAAGTGTCSDGNNCTINDACAGDGGCAGMPVTCTPTQCQNPSTTCDTGGTCIFTARDGQTCDAGTGGAATCNTSANCIATPLNLFPFTPSNFTEAQLPADAGTGITVSCTTTLNTSGTPAITNGGCVVMPPYSIITQGGESTLLIRVPSLAINSGQTLLITGTRPVIFAVTGNVLVDGTIRVRAGNGPAACGNGGNGNNSGSGSGNGGGGGGGFGTAGATGGTAGGGGAGGAGAQNGAPTLVPLRGGCSGGNGTSNGGAGGVAFR